MALKDDKEKKLPNNEQDEQTLPKEGVDTSVTQTEEQTNPPAEEGEVTRKPLVQSNYNAATDETLNGVQQSYKDLNDVWDKLGLNRQADIDEAKAEDAAQTKRDKQAAFWQSIGEVGASIINQLGVSGAFHRRTGGKGNYNSGWYSSMMNFNLTAGQMTEAAKADHEKRQARIDGLRDALDKIQSQQALYKVEGAKNYATLRMQREKAAQDKADAQNRLNEMQYQYDKKNELDAPERAARVEQIKANTRKANADAEGQEEINKQIKNGTSPSEKGSGSGYDKDYIHEPYTGTDGTEHYIEGNRTAFWDGVARNHGELENVIAQAAGYKNIDAFKDAMTDQKITINQLKRNTGKTGRRKGKGNAFGMVGPDGQQIPGQYIEDLGKVMKAVENYGKPGISKFDYPKELEGAIGDVWHKYPAFGEFMEKYMKGVASSDPLVLPDE